MRLFPTCICLLVLSATDAAAQVKPAAGIEAGVGWSGISPALLNQTISRDPGVLLGAYGLVPVTKNYGFQIEGLYEQKHTTIDGRAFNVDYLEIPLLARLPMFKSLYMTEGVGFAFPVRAQGVDKNQIANPDVSLIIGGGIPIRKAAIELRYDGSFTRVIRSADVKQLNRTWTVLVRWHL